MSDRELNRRDFSRLTMAAFGGLVAGAGTARVASAQDEDTNPRLLLEEPHVCRGLNTCEGKAKGGENDCAGMGTCATAEPHACNGLNECKGQGGCGEKPGMNTCEGKGACNVPIKEDKTWEKARKKFEELMKAEGKEVGPAPPKPKS